MGKRTEHAPGTFCWVDLATTDTGAAKAFYEALFGWGMEDADIGRGAPYTTCRIGGDAVCGLYEVSEEMRSAGARPNWISYVSVDAADSAVARAQDLGGHVIRDAFDIADAGRTAVLEDAEGAAFAVWEPRARIGAERVNDVGCLCMNELATTDRDAARAFYEGLFGWTTEPIDAGPDGPVALAHNDETLNASFFAARQGARPHWRPVFTVESTEVALDLVRDLGGRQLSEPLELPDGSVAVVADPRGAPFALFAGEVDP